MRLRQLRQTPTTRCDTLADAPAAALDFRQTAQDWSAREILAHRVDDEMFVMRTRLERIVKEERPVLAPHDEQKWYDGRNTARDDLPALLGDFDTQRAASLGIFALLRESEWERVGFQPEYGEFTAADWLVRWLEHDKTHIEQVASNLARFREEA